MKAPRPIVSAMNIDPAAPSLFFKTAPAQFARDEVRLNPPRDASLEVQSAKRIIDSGRSLYLEMTNKISSAD